MDGVREGGGGGGGCGGGGGGGGGGWMSQRTVNTSMQFRQGMTFSVYKESSNT